MIMGDKWKMADEVIRNPNIRYNEFGVYMYLWKLTDINKGYAHPSREKIFKELGISNKTFDRIIKTLVDEGHIRVISGKKNVCTRYYLMFKDTKQVDTKQDDDDVYTLNDYSLEELQILEQQGFKVRY